MFSSHFPINWIADINEITSPQSKTKILIALKSNRYEWIFSKIFKKFILFYFLSKLFFLILLVNLTHFHQLKFQYGTDHVFLNNFARSKCKQHKLSTISLRTLQNSIFNYFKFINETLYSFTNRRPFINVK